MEPSSQFDSLFDIDRGLEPDARLFVKVCGVTNESDALLAAGLGADAIGLVFSASAHRITAGRARDIVRRLPPEILTVGLFSNERPSKVVETANSLGLRVVQLGGHESPEETRWVAERVPAVIRAFSARNPALSRHRSFGQVRLLVEASESLEAASTQGEHGDPDWLALQRLGVDQPFVLSGGLTVDNVARAISLLDPWGIDVNHGVESEPGHKDPVKLRHFMVRARQGSEISR